MRIALFLLLFSTLGFAGECPKTLTAYRGSTPTLDGVIADGEYGDATEFTGVADWFSDTKPAAENADDLSVRAWVKHDGNSLYFAFDVTDNLIYGFDTERWVSEKNPTANELNHENGWSWWGDGVEIMLNAAYEWSGSQTCGGDGQSWQVVCSSHKSTLGGLGEGGLMAGEPRTAAAWNHYETWTRNADMVTAVRLKSANEGRGYVIEWRIAPGPCMLQADGAPIDLSKENQLGLNIEITDLDHKTDGDGNWANFHHIDYWAKIPSQSKVALKSWGTLRTLPASQTRVGRSRTLPETFNLTNYPNPFNPATMIEFSLAENDHVSLEVFNAAGEKIDTLVNRRLSAGTHRIPWLAAHRPSGIYWSVLKNSSTSVVNKMLLLQ